MKFYATPEHREAYWTFENVSRIMNAAFEKGTAAPYVRAP